MDLLIEFAIGRFKRCAVFVQLAGHVIKMARQHRDFIPRAYGDNVLQVAARHGLRAGR